jgi:hypothetical protein
VLPATGLALSTVFETEISAQPLVPQFTAAPIVTEYACVAVVLPFVALTTKGYVPVAVGVPEIEVVEAVDVPRTKPVGRVPEATVQTNGPCAVPVAVRVCAYGTVVVPFGSDVGVMARVVDAGIAAPIVTE